MKRTLAPLFLAAAVLGPLRADEGMWLYNNVPKERIRSKYGFEVTDPWLEHLRRSSVRFNSGGSGSFVSEDGLVLSNHHVGADAIQKLSSEGRNLLRDGFHAKRTSEELKCVDLELNVLESIEDVTARVNAAVASGLAPEASAAARRRVMSEIEKESLDRTGFRSDVVTLYQGGAYHLYRFKKYTDVRLVFAPEQQAAFFGGDPDNFEFPRFNLDVCFFRVYEDGKPARVSHHLAWSKQGAAEGELTFVSGHPGRTSRALTVAELEFLRDDQFPHTLGLLKRREVLLTSWGARSAENGRRAKDELLGIQNSRKARDGGHAGLHDPALMQAKREAEAQFRKRLKADPALASADAAFDRIASAQAAMAPISRRYRLLESGHGFNSELFGIARRLLRSSEERSKPSGERLREYSDSARESFEQALFSAQPIHSDLEILTLGDSLTFLCEQLGTSDPLVQAVLAGRSPRDRAADLVKGTRLADVAERRRLHAGGASAVGGSQDAMIRLAGIVDAEARALRKQMEALDETKKQAHSEIAAARFRLEGASQYPDATFTLRLSYGVVKGYESQGVTVPAQTRMAGMFERSSAMEGRVPFDLPPRWLKRRSSMRLQTPFNFVSTHDIIGGNSGSPMVNRAGEFVGIIFDGNIDSLVLDFGYDEVKARALSVHSSAILEALRSVYGAKELVAELGTGRRRG